MVRTAFGFSEEIRSAVSDWRQLNVSLVLPFLHDMSPAITIVFGGVMLSDSEAGLLVWFKLDAHRSPTIKPASNKQSPLRPAIILRRLCIFVIID